MGLDTVQIIVDIEDCFDIRIADQDAAEIATVGELSDHVSELVKDQDGYSCLNQIVFFRLRKYFSKHNYRVLSSFSASMKISDLVAKAEIKILVDELSQYLNLKIPKIKKSLLVHHEDLRYSDTIQDMTDKVILQNMYLLRADHGISKATVDNVVKSVIYNITGLDRDKIIPEARIAYDLGID